jgi:hypothetical protein
LRTEPDSRTQLSASSPSISVSPSIEPSEDGDVPSHNPDTKAHKSGRKRGAWLSTADELLLVQCCINNQDLYGLGRQGWKMKFWDEIAAEFELKRGNMAPYSSLSCTRRMDKLVAKRKKFLEMNETGTKFSEGDLEHALDQWIQIVDEYENRLKRETEESAADKAAKDEAIATREAMLHTFKRKRKMPTSIQSGHTRGTIVIDSDDISGPISDIETDTGATPTTTTPSVRETPRLGTPHTQPSRSKRPRAGDEGEKMLIGLETTIGKALNMWIDGEERRSARDELGRKEEVKDMDIRMTSIEQSLQQMSGQIHQLVTLISQQVPTQSVVQTEQVFPT